LPLFIGTSSYSGMLISFSYFSHETFGSVKL
jgi:hypothetical protein